jgi:isopenicillin N synthase-like dioxygenase
MVDAWAPGSPELRSYNGTYVQLNYYEPSQHSAELLQDSHEDAHLLTLVKANAPGLEIEVDGKYVPAGADGNEIVFMPGSLLSLMTGYKIKPGYHQVRNTRRHDPRSSLLLFVNPEIDQTLEPWIKNESNAGIDIIERANEGPKQFGMPTLTDGNAGDAFPELMEHKEAVLAETSQPVRAKG